MEHLASAALVYPQLVTEFVQLSSLYAVLHYIGGYLGGCPQDYREHLGFRSAPCMVQYCFRGYVQPYFSLPVSECQNPAHKRGTDFGGNRGAVFIR